MLLIQLSLLSLLLVAGVRTLRTPLLESALQQEQDQEGEPEVALDEDGVDLGRFRQQVSTPREHRHSGGCSGGCSGSPRSASPPDDRPRPIYGLLSNILETARIAYRLDSPRARLLY